VNDAYYTLSNESRRREYDEMRRTSQAGAASGNGQSPEGFESEQFGSVFEEMLREEGFADGAVDSDGRGTGHFWSVVGGLSGGALGFIIANFPGALAGAVAGNRLGAVRDAKGKSVYEVFLELPQQDRANLLSELAARVLRSAIS
jgi:DnaJ-class molecular chaperone